MQPGRSSVFAIEGFEVGGGGCFDDSGKASFRGLCRQKASCDCILYHRLDARFGCHECSQVSYSGLACAECGLFRTLLRKSRVEPFKGPLSDLVVDFCSSSLLQGREAAHPEDVVNAG